MLQRVTSMLLVLQCSCHHCIVRCTLTLHTVIDLLTYLLIYLFIYLSIVFCKQFLWKAQVLSLLPAHITTTFTPQLHSR